MGGTSRERKDGNNKVPAHVNVSRGPHREQGSNATGESGKKGRLSHQ